MWNGLNSQVGAASFETTGRDSEVDSSILTYCRSQKSGRSIICFASTDYIGQVGGFCQIAQLAGILNSTSSSRGPSNQAGAGFGRL